MKRFIFFIAFSFLLFLLQPFRMPDWFGKQKENSGERIAGSRISVAYVLDLSQWTVFPLKPETEFMKIITNAGFSPPFIPDPEKKFRYALHYQILDKSRKVIADREYHHHTDLLTWLDKEGNTIYPRFYINEPVIPGSIKTMWLHFHELKGAAFLRLRWIRKDPEIVDMVVRVYEEEKNSARKIQYLWHRFSEEQKEIMARGNVYPHSLLYDTEIRNLLRESWRPVGPLGVDKKEYRQRDLYIRKDAQEPEAGETILPSGLVVDPFHRATIPLPEGGHPFLLDFSNISEQESCRIKIRWYGLRANERREWNLDFTGSAFFRETLEGGLLEIETDSLIRAAVSDPLSDPPKEIPYDPMLVRACKMGNTEEVVFPVNHYNGLPTPFRFDFRLYDDRPDGVKVFYRIEDEKGGIREGDFRIPAAETPDDLYSRWFGDTTGRMVSRAFSRFFYLGKDAVKIVFTSDFPLLVTGYNRTPDFVRRTRVPEDYLRQESENEIRQPAWFYLPPEDDRRLRRLDRFALLEIWYRPREIDPEILMGKYRHESFSPRGDLQGRYLLIPGYDDQPISGRFTPFVYRELPVNRQVELLFGRPAPGLETVGPGIVYHKTDPAPENLVFELDGHPYFERVISGTRGEIKLPPFLIGNHRVGVAASENTRIWINGAGGGKKAWFKRFALRMPRSGLTFDYEKSGDEAESLMVHFFGPHSGKTDTVIRVEIGGEAFRKKGPEAEMTLFRRRFEIRPRGEIKVPVLNTRDQYVDQGQLFFLTIGSDLPKGRYPVRFIPENREEGYMIFSRITPGEFEKRTFFREKWIRDFF